MTILSQAVSTPKRLGHHAAAAQAADRAAGARVEQVLDREQRGDHEHPDQVVVLAPGVERQAEDREPGHAGHPGLAAEELEIAEEVVEADAPGDRAERQVVAREAQRDRAEEERDRAGEREPDEEREPRRQPVSRAEVRGRVRPEADERRLPERREPAHPGEEHQPERDEAVEPDVVQQRDVELGQVGRPEREGREEDDEQGACPAHSSSSCSRWCVRRLRHSSTGMISVKTITSLNALAQNDENDSSRPTSNAPSAASG